MVELDAEANVARLQAIKAKMLEAIEDLTTWEEAEKRKLNATPNKVQK